MSPPHRAVPIAVRTHEAPYWGPRRMVLRSDAAFTVAFLLINALMQVLDAAATWLGLQLGGSEMNPVMAWLLSTPGPALFFFVKALVVVAFISWAVWIAWRREATANMRRGAEAMAIIFTLIVGINVAIISKNIYGLPLY